MNAIPVRTPAGYAPAFAIGIENADGHFAPLGPAVSLPTNQSTGPVPAALTGVASEAKTVGPFVPAPFCPVYLTLSGDWTGDVRLLRSTDGGATRHPVTLGGAEWGRFAGNVCEPVWSETERGATLWLDLAPVTGTIGWRIAQ